MKLRKVLVGLGWFVILYIIGSFILGFIGGFKGGFSNSINNPGVPYTSGAQAGRAMGEKYGWIVILIAVIVALIGTIKEKLPGTKTKQK